MSKMKNEQRSKSFNLNLKLDAKEDCINAGWSVSNWRTKEKEAKSLSKVETNEVHWFVDLYQGQSIVANLSN